MARPRLAVAEKARRGTLRPGRERKRASGPQRAHKAPQIRVRRRAYPAIAAQYWADVLSGRQVACTWIRLWAEQQGRDRLRAETDPTFPYVWSDEHATA